MSATKPTADHVQTAEILKPTFEMFAWEVVNAYPQHKRLTM